MKNGLRAAAAALALAGMVAALPAQAKCWSEAEASAAALREMDSMLMVSALRCRLGSRNFIAEYNRFVQQARPALAAANDLLRARMGVAGFDRYATSLANRYGAGADGMNCKEIAAILSDARDERGSANGLVRLAHQTGASTALPGGKCAPTIADRR
jgi:hypothetical protein